MKYQLISTGEIIPRSFFPEYFPNVSLPHTLSQADLDHLGVVEVPEPPEPLPTEPSLEDAPT